MRFSIGDKVKIRTDLKTDEMYGGVRFDKTMGEYLGEYMTISSIDTWIINTYQLDNTTWNWSEEMFEGSNKLYKLIEYYKENNEIKTHILSTSDTLEGINEIKNNVVNVLNQMRIETYEILATKNINRLSKILDREDVKIFRVMEE